VHLPVIAIGRLVLELSADVADELDPGRREGKQAEHDDGTGAPNGRRREQIRDECTS
jgi:hypothetical protein